MEYCELKKKISIVVPVKDEEMAIKPFLKEVFGELKNIKYKLEIIFVDDGSSDNTLLTIKETSLIHEEVKYISFSRNFGKEAAMSAGIEYATGDAVIPMDVDLQDPPIVIHEFIRLWEEGFDTVYGYRLSRNEDTTSKKMTAGMFYKVFNKISDNPIPYNAGDFRLIDRKVVDVLRKMPEQNRFMKGLFAWPGFKTTSVPYHRPARKHGKTKFNAWKLWNFAVDGITSFSTWPLRIWSYIGGGIAIVALFFMVFIIMRTILFGRDFPGYASIMSTILFFGSIQLISIGVLGEYIGRLYIEVKKRPSYVIKSKNI